MPLFRVQVHYTRGLLDKWSNVWHCNAATLLSAMTDFNIEVVPNLLTILHPSCSIARLLVSDPPADEFVIFDVNETGLSGDVSSLLPLFNCVRVNIPTPGFGRPDVKYMKGFATESNTENGLFTSGAQTAVDSAITTAIAAMISIGSNLCSNEGDNYTTVSVQPAVQMRQMHRKRKKKVTVV